MKAGALGSVAGIVQACSTMDRVIMGDAASSQNRVIIIGAGLAGLMAAYQLKQRGISFQIFEAATRIGGRVYTVPDFLRGQPNAELGGEWISSSHKTFFNLAKELRVEIVEAREFANPKFRRLGQISSTRSLARELSKLQARGMKSPPADNSSLADWFKKLSTDSFFTGFVNDWSLERFGTSSSQLRAQAFTEEWLHAGNHSLFPWTESRFRVRNGSSTLANAIFDRVGGYQPNLIFKLGHRLRSVRARSQGFDLYFETPGGGVALSAARVICAIPKPMLSSIDGISQVGGDGFVQAGVGTGQHSKLLLSYGERFWSSQMDQGKLLQLGGGQTLWESSFRGNPLFQFRQGILSMLWGGEASRQVGPHILESLKKEVPALFKASGNPQPLETAMMNWEKATLFQGSVSYPQVGRVLPSNGPEAPKGWAWAGEHMAATAPGTMDAALRSGVAAVEQILRQNSEESAKSGS